MKQIIIIILSCLSQGIYTQNVSLSLSINWREEVIPISNNEICKVPFLNITYKNETSNSIYLYKVFSDNEKTSIISYESDSTRNRMRFNDYSKKKYDVIIDDKLLSMFAWYAIPDSLSYYEAHEIDLINDELMIIYDQSKTQNNESENLTTNNTDNIWKKILDNLIFLKPNESHVDSFSLYGFMRLRGEYCFQIIPYKEHKNDAYVLRTGKFVKQKLPIIPYTRRRNKVYVFTGGRFIKQKLPNKIDGFQLYDKALNSDSIKIIF